MVRDRMIIMDPLPNTPPTTSPNTGASAVPMTGSMAKEQAPMPLSPETPSLVEIGKSADLPQEVQRAGVKMQSDTVTLPKLVQNMGVTAVGPSVPPASAATVVLPLTDDQIAQGLHQSIVSSWRWLAEWCERQLKQAHILLTSAHGKIIRTKTE
jgi:hypothetical protein